MSPVVWKVSSWCYFWEVLSHCFQIYHQSLIRVLLLPSTIFIKVHITSALTSQVWPNSICTWHLTWDDWVIVNKDKSLTKKQVHTNSLKYRMDIHFQTWCQNVPKLSNVLLQCMKEALLNLCARSCSLVYDIVLHFLTLATYRNGSQTKLSKTCMKSNPLDCRGK